MNFNPSHIGPGAGTFRGPGPSATPAGDAAPTERIGLGQQGARRIVSQPAVNQASRGQRTRRTVDLPAATHRALDIWQREAADRLGVARVTGQEVLTALIDQLLVDPKLAAQITRAIKDRR
ncbi:ATPase [Mycobacterium paraffinicum]|uniref:ATPase n=1 Tax=Mycobacterium paraffinicum TaxID=53378 RepID=A0ABP8R9Y3_9MYCO|nr:ATPase [Mycobacterium paraffinicum]MCV7311598.1 ATPase [Mycobacterium paraffinicum]